MKSSNQTRETDLKLALKLSKRKLLGRVLIQFFGTLIIGLYGYSLITPSTSWLAFPLACLCIFMFIFTFSYFIALLDSKGGIYISKEKISIRVGLSRRSFHFNEIESFGQFKRGGSWVEGIRLKKAGFLRSLNELFFRSKRADYVLDNIFQARKLQVFEKLNESAFSD